MKRIYHIAIALNRSLKAAKDEIAGILASASKRDNWEIRILDRNISKREFRLFAQSWGIDGLIADNRASSNLDLTDAKSVAVVFIDSPLSGHASVTIDNQTVAETAADFFLKRRHTSFGFVGTDDRFAAYHSLAREESFTSRIASEGFHCDVYRLAAPGSKMPPDETHRLAVWIKALPKPCGILVCSDLYAHTVYEACRRVKAKIPEQVAILSIDNDTEVDETLVPSLSSILPDFVHAGTMAAEKLDALLAKAKPRAAREPVHYGVKCLVERDSTSDYGGTSRLASAALSLIRENALSGITVEAVSKQLKVDRRLLELHFKKVRGHTLRDEILDLRLTEVRRLLAETPQSVKSIAATCGWKSTTALQILFKRRYGHAMSEERCRKSRYSTKQTQIASKK